MVELVSIDVDKEGFGCVLFTCSALDSNPSFLVKFTNDVLSRAKCFIGPVFEVTRNRNGSLRVLGLLEIQGNINRRIPWNHLQFDRSRLVHILSSEHNLNPPSFDVIRTSRLGRINLSKRHELEEKRHLLSRRKFDLVISPDHVPTYRFIGHAFLVPESPFLMHIVDKGKLVLARQNMVIGVIEHNLEHFVSTVVVLQGVSVECRLSG